MITRHLKVHTKNPIALSLEARKSSDKQEPPKLFSALKFDGFESHDK